MWGVRSAQFLDARVTYMALSPDANCRVFNAANFRPVGSEEGRPECPSH
jgi:hypothetical protein